MTKAKRIGIVGGGQLGRMLTQAAIPLGFSVMVLDPTPYCPAAQVGAEQIVGGLKEHQAIAELAEWTGKDGVLTFEIEHIDTDALAKAARKHIPVHPSPQTLAMIKNKLEQKRFLQQVGIPTAAFMEISNDQDLLAAGEQLGYPYLLKTQTEGYDGRGNAVVEKKGEQDKALAKLRQHADVPVYAEKFVPFQKELAVMVARSIDGKIATYPVVETVHARNILQYSLAPAPIDQRAYQQAASLAKKTMQHLKGAGVFGIEMFLTQDDDVLINEIAPRVHNSGHYTKGTCATSQFEQHIRAVTGMPLGDPSLIVPAAVMVNILGERNGQAELQGLADMLTIPHASLEIYGKAETRSDRKMGHITVWADNLDTAYKNAIQARKAVTI
jgi:phosphoribosylaminoimidazole carboxylase PurK protein